MSWFNRIFGVKESQARAIMTMQMLGKPQSTPANYKGFTEEGYQKNVVAYKCVSALAKACGSVEWLVYQKSNTKTPKQIEDPNHGLVKLLIRPNPTQAWPAFAEAVSSYYAISGNSYLEANGPGAGAPTELWPVRPDLMKVIPGALGLPAGFEFGSGGNKKIFPVDQITGKSPILQLKTFHPTNLWYGMSPIEAASMAVDQHNESSRWNLSLLQNKATPSGALVVTVSDKNPGGTLSDDQFNRAKHQIEEQFMGARNAARPLLLEGGMDWKPLSFSPNDMDWIEGKHTSARDIALAFGVPPILLNIPGDSTFANYKEARLAFWEDTVLSMLNFLKAELNHWLCPAFGDGIYLDYDRDGIEALAPKREAVWTRVQTADWLTINEKREATGYEEIEGGDEILVGMSLTPLAAVVTDADDDDDNDGHPTGDPNEDPNEAEEPEDNGAAELDNQNDGSNADENEPPSKSNKIFNLKNENQKRRYVKTFLRQRTHLENKFAAQVAGAFRKEGRAVSEAVKGIHDKRLAEATAEHMIEKHKSDMRHVIRTNLAAIMEVFGKEVMKNAKSGVELIETKDSDTRFMSFIKSWIETYSEPQITGITGTTLKRVRQAIKDAAVEHYDSGDALPAFSEKIQEAYDGFEDSRATLIARTETTIASNQGSLGAAKAIGVDLTKEWVAVEDARTRDDHAAVDGTVVDINETFKVGGSDMDGPGDPKADISEIANCRCTLVYARAKGDDE